MLRKNPRSTKTRHEAALRSQDAWLIPKKRSIERRKKGIDIKNRKTRQISPSPERVKFRKKGYRWKKKYVEKKRKFPRRRHGKDQVGAILHGLCSPVPRPTGRNAMRPKSRLSHSAHLRGSLVNRKRKMFRSGGDQQWQLRQRPGHQEDGSRRHR